ncbi:hypothetical protein [Streptomyces sp. NPDC014006]|uniref:hypothetical protein n=1 Tax=Streptomyces sp. NPDC014006 TaxID=3364870 RepID=UPI0036FD7575
MQIIKVLLPAPGARWCGMRIPGEVPAQLAVKIAALLPHMEMGRLMNISCPVCHAKPDAECSLPAGSHQARQDILSYHLDRDSGGRR